MKQQYVGDTHTPERQGAAVVPRKATPHPSEPRKQSAEARAMSVLIEDAQSIEIEPERPFEVINLDTKESHGRYATLAEARGCVQYDRLRAWEIFENGKSVSVGDPGRLTLSDKS